MRETFRLSRWILYLGLFGVVAYGSIGIGCILVVMVLRQPAGYEALFSWGLGGFFLALVAMSSYLVLAYRFERLVIDGHLLTLAGTFQTTEIDLTQVTDARWHQAFGGKLTLAAGGKHACISFANHYVMTSEQEQRLIEFMQSQIPRAIQKDWAWFRHCHFAPREPRPQGPRRGYVLATRKRLDLFVVPAALVTLVTGATVGAWLGDGVLAAQGVIFAVFLVSLRFIHPRQGEYQPTIWCPEHPEVRWPVVLLVVGCSCMVVRRFIPEPIHSAIMGALAVATGVFSVYVIRRAMLQGRERLNRVRQRRAEVEAEWNGNDSAASTTMER